MLTAIVAVLSDFDHIFVNVKKNNNNTIFSVVRVFAPHDGSLFYTVAHVL